MFSVLLEITRQQDNEERLHEYRLRWQLAPPEVVRVRTNTTRASGKVKGVNGWKCVKHTVLHKQTRGTAQQKKKSNRKETESKPKRSTDSDRRSPEHGTYSRSGTENKWRDVR